MILKMALNFLFFVSFNILADKTFAICENIPDGTFYGKLDGDNVILEVTRKTWIFKLMRSPATEYIFDLANCKVEYLSSRDGVFNLNENTGNITGAHRVFCENPLGLFYCSESSQKLIWIGGSDQPYVEFKQR